jgi:hypothetical protein
MGPSVIADLDTLLITLYVELTDRIIPRLRPQHRAGPGRPPVVSDAEVVCLAVAQVLLRYHDEHHWLRAAPTRVGHLFPRLLSQPEYNRRLRQVADLMEAALRWLADHTPLRPSGCGCWTAPGGLRPVADHRHAVGPGRLGRLRPRHLPPLLLLGGPAAAGLYPGGDGDRVRTGQPQAGGRTPGGGGPAPAGPGNRPAPGTLLVGDKGLAGGDFQTALAGLELVLVRPARADEPDLGVFPNWLRQRVEAIIWTLKHQLGLDRPGGRIPSGLWARVVQRLLALNAAIWFNWQIGAPVKRSLTAYDH